MTSCCMIFAIIFQWIYCTIWKKIKKNHHHYNTISNLLQYHIKTLQEEFAKKSNIPWIWRIIYGHKLPYMKKTRKKKQVCGAACFMAAEIKFSKDICPSVCLSVCYTVLPLSPLGWRGIVVTVRAAGRAGGRLPNLRNPYLCNRLMDFLHSKFCRIV